jgi:hypothetical protein
MELCEFGCGRKESECQRGIHACWDRKAAASRLELCSTCGEGRHPHLKDCVVATRQASARDQRCELCGEPRHCRLNECMKAIQESEKRDEIAAQIPKVVVIPSPTPPHNVCTRCGVPHLTGVCSKSNPYPAPDGRP